MIIAFLITSARVLYILIELKTTTTTETTVQKQRFITLKMATWMNGNGH